MKLVDFAVQNIHAQNQLSLNTYDDLRIDGSEILRIASEDSYEIRTLDGKWEFSVNVRADGTLVRGYMWPVVSNPDAYGQTVEIDQANLPAFADFVLQVCQFPLPNYDCY